MRLLEVQDVVKTYGRRCVVNRVSFHIDEGDIVGLLGPNGAGKTTTFLMTVGRVRPDSGAVLFKGKEVTRMPMYQRARLGLGYLSQERSDFQKLTVEENILAILETQPIRRADRARRLDELLEELDLVNLRKNRAYTLSGGERRRLEITRALASTPDLILLDEPFAGVDPIAVAETQEIVRSLKKRNISVLLTDHNVRETLSITDRSYIIAEGRIIQHGTARELVDDPNVRKVYLGENFSMFDQEIPPVPEEAQLSDESGDDGDIEAPTQDAKPAKDSKPATDRPSKSPGPAKDSSSMQDADKQDEASPLYRQLQDEATAGADDDAADAAAQAEAQRKAAAAAKRTAAAKKAAATRKANAAKKKAALARDEAAARTPAPGKATPGKATPGKATPGKNAAGGNAAGKNAAGGNAAGNKQPGAKKPSRTKKPSPTADKPASRSGKTSRGKGTSSAGGPDVAS